MQRNPASGETARHTAHRPAPVSLRPVLAADASALFPLIYRSKVTETILWDGPDSLEEYRAALADREAQMARGQKHMFTILFNGNPVGSCDFRPGSPADMGLWIGEKFQGQGIGTQAIKELVKHGFQMPETQTIESHIFVGNFASRRIFEKNGFTYTGNIPAEKHGKPIEEWVLALKRSEYEAHH